MPASLLPRSDLNPCIGSVVPPLLTAPCRLWEAPDELIKVAEGHGEFLCLSSLGSQVVMQWVVLPAHLVLQQWVPWMSHDFRPGTHLVSPRSVHIQAQSRFRLIDYRTCT